MTKLTGQQIADEALAGWAFLLCGLQTRLHTGTFAAGLSIVTAIGAAAEELDHHPDLDLRYTHLDVRLTSHDADGVTERDVRLARIISSIAGQAGVRIECASVSGLEMALDSPAFASVLPFWQAVLAPSPSSEGGDDEIRDAFGALPTVWFQPSGSEEPRQHWHPDLWIDPSQVGARIDAALAAGGTLVSDKERPASGYLPILTGTRCACAPGRTGIRLAHESCTSHPGGSCLWLVTSSVRTSSSGVAEMPSSCSVSVASSSNGALKQ